MAIVTRAEGVAREAKATPAPAGTSQRLDSIDWLRGLIMVIMALDHTRSYFSNAPFDPTDLGKTDAAYFLTRWITHYCAPTFLFLAGVGAYLYGSRGKTRSAVAWFLLTRGLWLVVLELTVIRVVWIFPVHFNDSIGAVIWAIGWSMVALSALVYLPTSAIAAIGIAIVVLHNSWDRVPPDAWGDYAWLWKYLHTGGPIELWTIPSSDPEKRFVLFFAYPVLPWIGTIACGYALGAFWTLEPRERQKQLIGLGAVLTALFVVVRGINLYGDLRPWSLQDRGWEFTVFSFLNVHKYPPSLCFLLMTLGPGVLVLGLLARAKTMPLPFLVTYGRVPLFYYALHFPIIHGSAILLSWLRHGEALWLCHGSNLPRPAGAGVDLWVVYLIWLTVVALLYLPCRWFAGVKQRRRDWWLSYL